MRVRTFWNSFWVNCPFKKNFVLNTHCNIVWSELPINTQTTFRKKTCKFTNKRESFVKYFQMFRIIRFLPLPTHSNRLRESETLSASGDAKYRHIYIVDTANRIPAAKRLRKQCCLQHAILENNLFLDMLPLMWQKLDVISCTRGQSRKGGVLHPASELLYITKYKLAIWYICRNKRHTALNQDK